MQDLTVILDGVTVADGTAAVGIVEDWQAAPSEDAIERSDRISAARPRFFDLTTVAEKLVLRVGRQHASYRAALTFEREHRADIGLVGDVSFGFDEDGVAWLCEYADAKISPIGVQRMGVFTLTTYGLEFSGPPTITEDGEPVAGAVLVDYSLQTPAAAGTTTPTIDAGIIDFTLHVQAAAGAGAYTHIYVLDTANREAGESVKLRLELPASANPTIEIRNGTGGGTLLASRTGTALGATNYAGHFVFNGTAWKLISILNEA